jgi:hypothetical protein
METGKRFSRGWVASSARALAAGGVLAALLAGLAGAFAQAQDEGVAAGWQRHRTSFSYLGISPTYSCVGLQDALTFLILQSGAQLNHPVAVFPCNGGGVPTPLLSAMLDFSTLQPAPGGAENAGTVNAVWRHVEFSMNRSQPQLHGSDCELVDEFRAKVLPMFATRNVQSNLRCIPHQTIGNQFSLRFDVLAAPDASNRAVGGAG